MNNEEGYSRYIKSLAMDLVVVFVAGAYVMYQMVTLEPTQVNPLVLVAQALMGVICGVLIKQSLGENGFSMGYNSDTWKREETKYNDSCTTAIPYMDKVDNFYQYEEIEKKRNLRRQILQSKKLKYEMWFDNEGNYIDRDIWWVHSSKTRKFRKSKKPLPDNVSILTIKQMLALVKSVRVKIYPLNMFSHYANNLEQYTRKEVTDNKQRINSATKNIISAFAVAIVGVYFIPSFQNWNWANFVTALFQVSLWVLLGVMQLYTNYNFVIHDRTATLKTKKEDIVRFKSGCEKHLYDNSPYLKITRQNELAN